LKSHFQDEKYCFGEFFITHDEYDKLFFCFSSVWWSQPFLRLRLMLCLKLRPSPNSILEDMELDMEDMVMATMVLDMEEFIMESEKLKLRPSPNSIQEDLVHMDMGLDTMVLDMEESIMESARQKLRLNPNLMLLWWLVSGGGGVHMEVGSVKLGSS
jgi:hypothetical protein